MIFAVVGVAGVVKINMAQVIPAGWQQLTAFGALQRELETLAVQGFRTRPAYSPMA